MTDLITFSFKRDEDSILQEVQEYIASTYDAHYVGENDIQTIDVWQSLGTLDTPNEIWQEGRSQSQGPSKSYALYHTNAVR